MVKNIVRDSYETLTKADDRTRTDNLLITNQLLCQLSHIGKIYLINFADVAIVIESLIVK